MSKYLDERLSDAQSEIQKPEKKLPALKLEER